MFCYGWEELTKLSVLIVAICSDKRNCCTILTTEACLGDFGTLTWKLFKQLRLV